MGFVRDFNQITYAARTLERIQKAKETKWSVQVSHAGLGRSKVIRGPSKQFVEAEASQQLAAWNAIWQQQEESARNRATRAFERRSAEQRVAFVAEQKSEAERRTDAAKAEIAAVEGILAGFANFDGKLDWGALKPDPAYTVARPKLPPLAPAPTPPVITEEPKRRSLRYELDVLVGKRCITAPPPKPEINRVGFVGKLFGAQKRADIEYEAACATWNSELRKYEAAVPALIDQIFATDHQNWERAAKQAKGNFDEANSRRAQESARQATVIDQWNQLRDTWDVRVGELEQKVGNCRRGYTSSVPLAVADYFSAILAMAEHPVWVPQAWTMFYEPDFRRLNVSYRLPNLADVPSIASHTYVQKTDSFVKVELKKGLKDTLYVGMGGDRGNVGEIW